jgi:hypothetical protein
MSDETTVEAARDAVAQLLKALGVTKVICVDDIYAKKPSLDDLLDAQASLREEELREIFGRPTDVFPEDREVRRQSFREAWAALNDTKQNEVASRILAAAAASAPLAQPNDFIASAALAKIIGANVLSTVSPSKWTEVKSKLKSERAEGRTLLLFDQDLSGDGGAATGGIVLAQDALTDREIGDRVMCGLLTHTATIETQNDERVRLAQPPLDQDRFIVVAKAWLSIDPMGFARMLKMVALGPDCRAIKKRARELLDAATHEALQEIDKLQIDDFDSMVFRASKQEGLWEPDMLFRLFGIYHRAAVRRSAYVDNQLKSLSNRLRSVSDISTSSMTSAPLTTWKVQQKEMYDRGEYINSLHLPIEVGDIFSKTGGDAEKFYIVLGQPCDLMVRSDGKRYPEETDVVLAEIFSSSAEKEYTSLLPYFMDDPSRKFYVRLRATHSVHPNVLDLCVYNADGVSRIDIDSSCSDNVLPAWKPKYERLKRHAQSILRRYESFGHNKVKEKEALRYMQTESPKQFPIFTSNSGLFKGSMTFAAGQRRLSFNCKRVMRLHRPRALAISLEYAQCLTRPAFDRDLGT